MGVQVIMNQQKGPLPVKATFNSPSSGPMYLEVVGSVWTTTANQLIGIGIKVDDAPVRSGQIFSNPASTHRSVVISCCRLPSSHRQSATFSPTSF